MIGYTLPHTAALPSRPADTTACIVLVARSAACRYQIAGMNREDCEQEAALACWQSLRSYDPARHPDVGAYLYQRATARLARLLKRALRRQAKERQLQEAAGRMRVAY